MAAAAARRGRIVYRHRPLRLCRVVGGAIDRVGRCRGCGFPVHPPAPLTRGALARRDRRGAKGHADPCFVASTLGVEPAEAMGLAACGFDLVAHCSRAWDYRAGGFGNPLIA